MKCNHCGANIDDDSKFCPVCGNKLEKNDKHSQETDSENIKKSNIFVDKFKKFTNKSKPKPEKEEGLEAIKDVNPKPEEPSPIKDASGEGKIIKEEILKDKQVMKKQDLGPIDRMDKSSRRLENFGESKQKANQRSVIEEVQDKVSRNQKAKKDDSNFYIDKNTKMGKDDLEEKLDRLIGDESVQLSNITVSAGIRRIQDRKRKFDREQSLGDLKDRTAAARPLKEKSLVPVEEVKEEVHEPEKGKKEGKSFDFKKYFTNRNIIIAVVVLLIAVLGSLLYMKLHKVEYIGLNLSDYITVSYEGEDGSGIPKAGIDQDKLIGDYQDKIKYISRDNNKDSYPTPAHEFAADLANNAIFQYSKDQGLSNGDEITIMANLDNIKLSDKYNVQITSASKPVIVEGIGGSDPNNPEQANQEGGEVDPFEFIDVKFEGKSPDITLTTSLKDGAPEYMHTIEVAPAKTSGISDGEDVEVKLNFNPDQLEETYKVKLNPTTKTFKASSSEEASDDSSSDFIKSTANLDEAMLGDMKAKAGDLIKQTILYKNLINVDNIEYLGSFTGFNEDQNAEIKNRVYLIYEVSTSEKLADVNYQGNFKYYTFVEYQNVSKKKDGDGKFFSGGPQTTDNQIFHKFFIESEYKYYQIEYQGFGFIDKVLAHVGGALEGLTVTQDNKTDVNKHFATSDGAVGEYQADNQRLSLKADGSLVYQIDKAVHTGSYSLDGNKVSASIKGINVDTPISLTYDNGSLKAEEQGEFRQTSFQKIQNF